MPYLRWHASTWCGQLEHIDCSTRSAWIWSKGSHALSTNERERRHTNREHVYQCSKSLWKCTGTATGKAAAQEDHGERGSVAEWPNGGKHACGHVWAMWQSGRCARSVWQDGGAQNDELECAASGIWPSGQRESSAGALGRDAAERVRARYHLDDSSLFMHQGLVDEGVAVLETMKERKVILTEQVYNCMVDLFARVGRLDEAEKLMRGCWWEKKARWHGLHCCRDVRQRLSVAQGD